MARKIEIIFEFVYSFLVDRRKLIKNSAMSIQINTKIDKNLSFTDSMNSIPIGFQFCTCSNETERLRTACRWRCACWLSTGERWRMMKRFEMHHSRKQIGLQIVEVTILGAALVVAHRFVSTTEN